MSEFVPRSRPRNPWLRLGLLAAAFVAAAASAVAFIIFLLPQPSEPPTLTVALDELPVGRPRFYPRPDFGSVGQQTLGVWVVRRADGSVDAFYSRDPASGCPAPWRADFQFERRVGVFRDPCWGSTYTMDGVAIFGPTPRGLDRFDVTVSARTVIVQLDRVRLGPCRTGGFRSSTEEESECSLPSAPVYREWPPPSTRDLR